MSILSNPFTVLLDPARVLATCANSTALNALPVSAVRSADRPGAATSERLLAHDVAIDALFEELASKSSRKRTVKQA